MAIKRKQHDQMRLGNGQVPPGVTINPYFGDQVLLVAASLNGGNVLETFIETLLKWNTELGLAPCNQEIDRNQVWKRLISLAEEAELVSIKNSLQCEPKLFAERHDKQRFGSMSNIRFDNLASIGHVFAATCRGLITNLRDMISVQLLRKLGCKRVVATGSALIRNPVLRKCLEEEFAGFEIVYKSSSDSALGAATFLKDYLSK
jgi:sedoheptulokinase